jgi:hypothetical protein
VAHFWPEPEFEPDAGFEAAWHERLKRFAAFNGCTYQKSKLKRRAT